MEIRIFDSNRNIDLEIFNQVKKPKVFIYINTVKVIYKSAATGIIPRRLLEINFFTYVNYNFHFVLL